MTGWLAATGCALVALFQLAIAAGAPFGRASWGGAHPGRLPTGFRIASLTAVFVWTFAALLTLRRAGHITSLIPYGIAQTGIWVLTALFAVSTLTNLASRSRLERSIWSPFGAVLTVLCFLLARSPT